GDRRQPGDDRERDRQPAGGDDPDRLFEIRQSAALEHEEDHNRDLANEQRREHGEAPERGAPEFPDKRRALVRQERRDFGIEGFHLGTFDYLSSCPALPASLKATPAE